MTSTLLWHAGPCLACPSSAACHSLPPLHRHPSTPSASPQEPAGQLQGLHRFGWVLSCQPVQPGLQSRLLLQVLPLQAHTTSIHLQSQTCVLVRGRQGCCPFSVSVRSRRLCCNSGHPPAELDACARMPSSWSIASWIRPDMAPLLCRVRDLLPAAFPHCWHSGCL